MMCHLFGEEGLVLSEEPIRPLSEADPLVDRLLRSGRYGDDRHRATEAAENVRDLAAAAVDEGADPDDALEAAIAAIVGGDGLDA